MKRFSASRRAPWRAKAVSSRASSARAHSERRKKYDRPSRRPRAYAVAAPATLPARHAASAASSRSTPVPARKHAKSIVESPGTGGKTYSSQAIRRTSRRPAHGWARSVPWMASVIADPPGASDLLDQVAQEGDGPALAAQGLDHANQRQGHVEQGEVDEREAEQPAEDLGQGRQDRPDEDHAEEDEAGDAAQDQPLLGVPAHVLAAGHHERHEGQDPEVGEDQHHLVLLVEVLGGHRVLFRRQGIGGHGWGSSRHRFTIAIRVRAGTLLYNSRPSPCQGERWTARRRCCGSTSRSRPSTPGPS